VFVFHCVVCMVSSVVCIFWLELGWVMMNVMLGNDLEGNIIGEW